MQTGKVEPRPPSRTPILDGIKEQLSQTLNTDPHLSHSPAVEEIRAAKEERK